MSKHQNVLSFTKQLPEFILLVNWCIVHVEHTLFTSKGILIHMKKLNDEGLEDFTCDTLHSQQGHVHGQNLWFQPILRMMCMQASCLWMTLMKSHAFQFHHGADCSRLMTLRWIAAWVHLIVSCPHLCCIHLPHLDELDPFLILPSPQMLWPLCYSQLSHSWEETIIHAAVIPLAWLPQLFLNACTRDTSKQLRLRWLFILLCIFTVMSCTTHTRCCWWWCTNGCDCMAAFLFCTFSCHNYPKLLQGCGSFLSEGINNHLWVLWCKEWLSPFWLFLFSSLNPGCFMALTSFLRLYLRFGTFPTKNCVDSFGSVWTREFKCSLGMTGTALYGLFGGGSAMSSLILSGDTSSWQTPSAQT